MRRHLTVICTSSFGDPKSDDMHRPMWSSAPSPEMSASFGRDYLVSLFAIQRPKSPVAYGDTIRLSEPSSFGDPESDDTHRRMWSSARFLEMSIGSGREYFRLTFCYPATQESGGMQRHLTVIRTFVIRKPLVR